MVDWPDSSSLPLAAEGTLQQSATPSYVEDDAQVGAPRRRKRFSRTLRTFSFGMILTDTQKDSLETFFYTTTSGGVSEFNWTHPESSVSYEVRFASPPNISSISSGSWRAQVEFEEI